MNMILDFVNDVNTEIYHKTILIKAAALVDFFREIRYFRIEITLKMDLQMIKKNHMTTHICSSQTAFYHELQPRNLYRIIECSDEASRPCGMYRTL